MVELFGISSRYNIYLYVFFGVVIMFFLYVKGKGFFLKHEIKKVKLGNLIKSKPGKVPGIIFGLKGHKQIISPVDDKCPHVAVIGGSGLGKTSALLIPTLRTLNNESAFIIDISGDIYMNTKDYIKNKIAFAPGVNGSACYDVFRFVDLLKN